MTEVSPADIIYGFYGCPKNLAELFFIFFIRVLTINKWNEKYIELSTCNGLLMTFLHEKKNSSLIVTSPVLV